MNAPEAQKPRTLYGGILKVLSGVDDIQVALTKWRLYFAAAAMLLATGGVIDRVQGFPMAHWAAKGLIPDSHGNAAQLQRMERKQDSSNAIILAKIDTLVIRVERVEDTLGTMGKKLTKTQVVLTEVARLTKTDKTIRKEQEKSRGLFDIWGVR